MDIDEESGKDFLRRNPDIDEQLQRDLFVALVGQQLVDVGKRFIFEPMNQRTADQLGRAFSEVLGRLHRDHKVVAYRVEQDEEHHTVTVDVRTSFSPSCVRIVYAP